jgi:hypothetical protein
MTGEAGQATPARRLELVTDPADGLDAALVAGIRAREVDGDLEASRQSYERAYQLAKRAGDVQAMALAALGLAGRRGVSGHLRPVLVVCQPGYLRSGRPSPAQGGLSEPRPGAGVMVQLAGEPCPGWPPYCAHRRATSEMNGVSRPLGPCSAWAASTWPSSAIHVWKIADSWP